MVWRLVLADYSAIFSQNMFFRVVLAENNVYVRAV
jgi:hypothetical protein